MTFINNLSSTAKKLIIAAIALILAASIIGGSIYHSFNTTNTAGVSQEADLVAQYKDNQNELGAYINKFNESLGIADRSSTKLNAIILDAVKGRYDNDSSLKPGTGGAMFSAIQEAYPDLTATTQSYAKVQDLVVDGRDAYKNKQSKLLDMLAAYDKWQNTGLIRKHIVQSLGFPSKNLRVTDSKGQIFTGQAALDKMGDIVLPSQARDAYDSGVSNPLITPESDPSTDK